MRIAGVFVAGLLAGGAFAAGTAFSQDAGGEAGAPPAPAKDGFKGADPRDHSPADIQRRMMEAVMPNRFHKKLERFLGEWDLEMRMWMSADRPPMTSKGSAKWSWLYEGKFVQGDVDAPLMGMPMRVRTVMGYDNFKKKYVSSVVNSLETSLRTFEGNHGKDENTLFLYGFVDEYTTGEHDKTAAAVYRFDGPDRITMEVHDLAIGLENARVFEWVMTRRK